MIKSTDNELSCNDLSGKGSSPKPEKYSSNIQAGTMVNNHSTVVRYLIEKR